MRNTCSLIIRDLKLALKWPRLLRRPRWVFKKALAEWHFEREKTTDIDFVLRLTGTRREDVLTRWEDGMSLPWPLLYVVVRICRPSIVVETGVRRGASSFSILQGLADNDQGRLYSIEMGGAGEIKTYGNTYCAPPDKEVGALVPTPLRDRWHLILGDAREQLPPLLSALGAIDVFYHDSLHTEEHMLFEYQAAWPYLREGGYLLSDDISFSFREFAIRVDRPYSCTGRSCRRRRGWSSITGTATVRTTAGQICETANRIRTR